MYGIYTISNNETLPSIANKYGTTIDNLLQINGLQKNYTPRENSQIVVPLEKNQTYKYYTVKKGDNVYEIAKNNNVDYELLLKINGLDKEDYIYPNQTLLLPQLGLNIYLTKQGDTLEEILENLNTNIEELLQVNKNIYLLPEQIITIKEK
jgi:LysM repeat protein